MDPSTGTLYFGDLANHQIRKSDPDGNVSQFSTELIPTSGVMGRPTYQMQPAAIARDWVTGEIYIADPATHVILKLSANGGALSIIAGDSGAPGYIDAVGEAARFTSPSGVALSPDRSFLYVTDSANFRIRAILLSTFTVTTFAGDGTSAVTDGQQGAGAQLGDPRGLVVAADGTVFFTDRFSVRKISGTPRMITTVAGDPLYSDNTDGLGAAARFRTLEGITLGPSGDLFVAEAVNRILRKLSPVAGSHDYQAALFAPRLPALNKPYGAAYSNGSFHIADSGYHRVIQITDATGSEGLVAGLKGISGAVNGSGSAALFNAPAGIVARSDGSLIVADSLNHSLRRVVRFSPVPRGLTLAIQTKCGWQTPAIMRSAGSILRRVQYIT